ncbi:DUF551 domain-containing protein [Shewanella sp.]|uniref:DUF551 domain-containing protein n=1 Tax=Shewanella sp. TaxID=50422 RepID=UPI003F2B1519
MKWIAVKDKSPNHDDMVVFAEISGGEFCSIVVGNYHYGKFRADTSGLQASNFDGDACIYLDDNMTVTHWMPLPPAPDHIEQPLTMVRKGASNE